MASFVIKLFKSQKISIWKKEIAFVDEKTLLNSETPKTESFMSLQITSQIRYLSLQINHL